MVSALQKFEESIRSEGTKKPYQLHLKKFLEFSAKNTEDIVKLQEKEIEELVFLYVVHLKRRVEKDEINPNSINPMFAPIQLFFEQNDIVLNWKKFKRMFPRKKAPANQSPYTEEEIRRILDSTTSLRNKALIHFLAATGCRVGAIPDLDFSDIIPIEDGAVVTIYRDDIEEYRTCLTPEAHNALKDYVDFRNLRGYPVNQNSPVFTNKSCSKRITDDAAKDLMRVILDSAGLRPKRNLRKSSKGKSANHAFRKRFETVLVNAGIHSKYIDFMMGHKVGQIRSYFKPTESEIWKEYKKAVVSLVIDKSEQLKIKNQMQQDELITFELESKSELESMKKQMHDERLLTLKMIGEAIKDPKKFQEKLEKLGS